MDQAQRGCSQLGSKQRQSDAGWGDSHRPLDCSHPGWAHSEHRQGALKGKASKRPDMRVTSTSGLGSAMAQCHCCWTLSEAESTRTAMSQSVAISNLPHRAVKKSTSLPLAWNLSLNNLIHGIVFLWSPYFIAQNSVK